VPRLLTTSSVPPQHRLSFWTEAISDAYVSVNCTAQEGRDSVDGELAVRSLASLDVSRVRATAQIVARTKRGISTAPDGYFLIGIHTQGRCIVKQDNRDALIENGSFSLCDTSRPYELHLSDRFEEFVVRMPKATLLRHLPSAEGLTARAVDGRSGAGPLIHTTIKSLANDIGMLRREEALAVAQGVEHLLIAGLSTLVPTSHQDVHTAEASRRAMIQQYIRKNLRDGDVGVASLSRDLHLSPSTIHRSFAADQKSVMGWIWQQRLDGIHQELASGVGSDRTLTQIALSWGFSNSAHFSRAFRRRYGYPPSSLRKTPFQQTGLAADNPGTPAD
jgi:AraC-like DNA-binding protein